MKHHIFLLLFTFLASCASAEAGYWSDDAGGGGGVAVEHVAYAACSGTTAGDLCLTTDGPITRVFDGASFDDCILGYGCADPIPTSGWTAQGDAVTVSTSAGIRTVTATSTQNGGHERRSATDDFQITMLVGSFVPDTTGGGTSLWYLEEDATGEALGIQMTGGEPGQLFVVRRPNGAFNATAQTILQTHSPNAGFGSRFWVRLAYDADNVGTEVTVGVSGDGVTYDTLLTEDEATSFTTAPDGLQFGATGNTGNMMSTLFLYDELPL